MVDVFICDDSQNFLDCFIPSLSQALAEVDMDAQTRSFTDPHACLSALLDAPCQVLFLDIQMPGLSGFDLAQKLKDLTAPPLLIFVSGLENQVYASFDYEPFYFLRKDYSLKELPVLVARLKAKLTPQYHVFRCERQDYRLPLAEIYYFESDAHYVLLHTKEKSYRYLQNFSALMPLLPLTDFVRIHGSFIVHLAHVRRFSKKNVYLTNGATLSISRRYLSEIEQRFLAFCERMI